MGGGASKSRAKPLQSTNPADAGMLGQLLRDAGVTKVILVRHANAKPRDAEAAAAEAGVVLKPDTPFANAWTVGDLARPLTAQGEAQAAAAAAYLDALAPLRAVVCSEAVRAIATKELMTRGRFPAVALGVLTLHTLHPSRSGTPKCEAMFGKLGYGTLATYYADTSVEGCEGQGKEVFREYVTKVTGELHALLAAPSPAGLPPPAGGAAGAAVAVFGHAVFLNAVAVAVGEAMGMANADDLVSGIELGEAQGILCDASKQSVELVKAA